MPMISYAQNREDVLLARALPGTNGFYVDVGAGHPIGHSVTKWFYEQGWSGVNLEPLPHFFQLVVEDRPRDVTLNAAASDVPGTLTLFEVPHSIGMSTVDPTVADQMTLAGTALIPHEVPARTLADVCAEHVGDRTIDFLKVDAEGHELAVLTGADFTRWRPRILVVEATEPGSPKPNHAAWEPMVLAADYLFATFDGLNRYYVRAEERELIELLSVPPNVFDDYLLAELVQEQDVVRSFRRELTARETDIRDLKTANAKTQTAYDLALQMLAQTRGHLENAQAAALRFPK